MNVHSKKARQRSLVYVFSFTTASCIAVAGCADPQLPDRGDFGDGSEEGGQPATSGEGGTGTGGKAPSTGGKASSGGHSSQGGATTFGGSTAPTTGGRSTSTGGRETGGSFATGGVSATGGTKATGGVSATGGDPSTGGVSPTGGTPATGGVSATGGIASSTGGVSATGGSPSTGGTAPSTGGSAVGGTSANLLKSSGFESSSLDGWRGRGSAMLAVSNEQHHTGLRSLKVTGRTAGWHGSEYDVMSLIKAGEAYDVTVWVRPTAGSVSSTLMLTRELQGCGATDFVWLASAANATDASWVELSGTLTIPSSCVPTKLVIYVESSNATLSYYVDDTFLRKR